MIEIETILSKKSSEYLEYCIYDETFDFYKKEIANELIRRSNITNSNINKEVIYECMTHLSITEVFDISNSENPCLAFIANCNIADRLKNTKNGSYFNDAKIKAKKKAKIKKRRKVLSYEY